MPVSAATVVVAAGVVVAVVGGTVVGATVAPAAVQAHKGLSELSQRGLRQFESPTMMGGPKGHVNIQGSYSTNHGLWNLSCLGP